MNPWPPRYHESYWPEPSSPYWFKDRECQDPECRDAEILKKIQAVMNWAWEQAPFYRRKWQAAGLEPGDIKSLDDFRKVPVLTKQELREDQASHPPFGSYLCIEPREVFHIHGTSGTTGKPTAFAIGRDDWRRIANAHARMMWGFGLRPGDTVFFGSFFSLYLGGWGALAGAERLDVVREHPLEKADPVPPGGRDLPAVGAVGQPDALAHGLVLGRRAPVVEREEMAVGLTEARAEAGVELVQGKLGGHGPGRSAPGQNYTRGRPRGACLGALGRRMITPWRAADSAPPRWDTRPS